MLNTSLADFHPSFNSLTVARGKGTPSECRSSARALRGLLGENRLEAWLLKAANGCRLPGERQGAGTRAGFLVTPFHTYSMVLESKSYRKAQ